LSATAEITHLTDEELIKEITASGSQRYVGELYRRYSSKIFRRSISLVKDQAAAEDITHDIFMKILYSLSSFKGNSKVSTWIYAISYNFCIDYLRKTKKARFNQNEYESYEGTQIDYVDSMEELQQIKSERLKDVMETVPIEDKMILLMKFQDGFSIKQIQEILNISESATKMRIKRAKEKVKKVYLEKYKRYE